MLKNSWFIKVSK